MSGSVVKPKRKRKKGWSKRVLLERVDFGDGKPVRAWLTMTDTGVEIQRWHSWKRWWVPLDDAAEVLCRRAQVRMCQTLTGRVSR